MIAKFEMADTVDSQKLAQLAIYEILKLPSSVLQNLHDELNESKS